LIALGGNHLVESRQQSLFQRYPRPNQLAHLLLRLTKAFEIILIRISRHGAVMADAILRTLFRIDFSACPRFDQPSNLTGPDAFISPPHIYPLLGVNRFVFNGFNLLPFDVSL
ncbi:MAG: hypothetical protein WBE74_05510, partial [Terracidiphilus sp.]